MTMYRPQDNVSSCKDEWSKWHDISNMTTISTELLVFMDTTWPYRNVVDYVNFVLQRLNINPYASSVTMFAASTGEVMVNTTHYLSELFENWNVTTHSRYPSGFNLPAVLRRAREFAGHRMNAERASLSMGGQSLIAMVIPSPVAYITDEDAEYCARHFNRFNESMPDLHFIYYAGGAVIRFKDFVWDFRNDLFPLNFEVSVERCSLPVAERIRRVPRRLVNPRCGADWWATTWGPDRISQLVHLGGVNFYRISSNYFPGREPMRFLKVEGKSAISFTICTSRTVVLPVRNGTATPFGVECDQAVVGGAYSYDLTDACVGYDAGDARCPPLYFSVQAQTFADVKQVSCIQSECQAPNLARFLIYVNNLSCNNGAGDDVFSSFFSPIFPIFLSLWSIIWM